MGMFAVIPVMTDIRDMYYRHKDASMYDGVAMGIALGVAEKWFILLSSTLFCLIFLSTGGFLDDGETTWRIAKRYIGEFKQSY
jgi:hypothetical protein